MKIKVKSKTKKSSIDVWENIYSQGQSILLYPDSNLVSLSRHLLKADEHHKVLDYSFGSGSNMIFLLKRGFEVSGVEVSPTAVNIVRKRLKKERLSAQLKLFKGTKLPYSDNTFDAVMAWQVLDYNSWESMAIAVKEIDRVLRPGGKFIGTITTTEDILCQSSKKVGNCLYQLKSSSQKDVIRMIVDRKNLRKCFPSRKISIGKFGFGYENIQSWHWIFTYEKN